MDYTRLPLRSVQDALAGDARETAEAFGALDVHRLNWRPDETRWSVGQCFDHLVTANRLMRLAADNALTGRSGTFWTRVPLLPRVCGPALIRSQAPAVTRTFTAPPAARPAASDLAMDVIPLFVRQQEDLVGWIGGVNEDAAARAIMQSPFLSFVVYSVLDGCRLMASHNRRHLEQARRVTQSPGFPAA